MTAHETANLLNLKMMCLSFAVNGGGHEDEIIARAEKYFAFVTSQKKRPNLRVVSNDDSGDVA